MVVQFMADRRTMDSRRESLIVEVNEDRHFSDHLGQNSWVAPYS